MAPISHNKVEALELLINMLLTTGQYGEAKKAARALRTIVKSQGDSAALTKMLKLEAVINYFAQEYELCLNLIERYLQDQPLAQSNLSQVSSLESNEHLDEIVEIRTMYLLKAKCLYLLDRVPESKQLLLEKLDWATKAP